MALRLRSSCCAKNLARSLRWDSHRCRNRVVGMPSIAALHSLPRPRGGRTNEGGGDGRCSSIRGEIVFSSLHSGEGAVINAEPAAVPASRAREEKCRRPSVDDVMRISRGQRAKKRGTGSRSVCHRLNADERLVFERAVSSPSSSGGGSRFLVLHNGSNRRERKGSPLWNIYRMWCDSQAIPVVACDLVRRLRRFRIKTETATRVWY